MNISSRRWRRIVVRVYVANWMSTTIAAKMNDAITAKRSRCITDGRRHASNIADDDEKSIWIGKMRRPGRYAAGADERNELLGIKIIQLIVIVFNVAQTKLIVIAQGIRFRA